MRVLEVAKVRSIDPEADLDAFRKIAREVEKRGEISPGSIPAKTPAHKECPNCLSWEVNSTEISTVKTVEGKAERSFEGAYECRNCKHEWSEKDSPAGAPMLTPQVA